MFPKRAILRQQQQAQLPQERSVVPKGLIGKAAAGHSDIILPAKSSSGNLGLQQGEIVRYTMESKTVIEMEGPHYEGHAGPDHISDDKALQHFLKRKEEELANQAGSIFSAKEKVKLIESYPMNPKLHTVDVRAYEDILRVAKQQNDAVEEKTLNASGSAPTGFNASKEGGNVMATFDQIAAEARAKKAAANGSVIGLPPLHPNNSLQQRFYNQGFLSWNQGQPSQQQLGTPMRASSREHTLTVECLSPTGVQKKRFKVSRGSREGRSSRDIEELLQRRTKALTLIFQQKLKQQHNYFTKLLEENRPMLAEDTAETGAVDELQLGSRNSRAGRKTTNKIDSLKEAVVALKQQLREMETKLQFERQNAMQLKAKLEQSDRRVSLLPPKKGGSPEVINSPDNIDPSLQDGKDKELVPAVMEENLPPRQFEPVAPVVELVKKKEVRDTAISPFDEELLRELHVLPPLTINSNVQVQTDEVMQVPPPMEPSESVVISTQPTIELLPSEIKPNEGHIVVKHPRPPKTPTSQTKSSLGQSAFASMPRQSSAVLDPSASLVLPPTGLIAFLAISGPDFKSTTWNSIAPLLSQGTLLQFDGELCIVTFTQIPQALQLALDILHTHGGQVGLCFDVFKTESSTTFANQFSLYEPKYIKGMRNLASFGSCGEIVVPSQIYTKYVVTLQDVLVVMKMEVTLHSSLREDDIYSIHRVGAKFISRAQAVAKLRSAASKVIAKPPSSQHLLHTPPQDPGGTLSSRRSHVKMPLSTNAATNKTESQVDVSMVPFEGANSLFSTLTAPVILSYVWQEDSSAEQQGKKCNETTTGENQLEREIAVTNRILVLYQERVYNQSSATSEDENAVPIISELRKQMLCSQAAQASVDIRDASDGPANELEYGTHFTQTIVEQKQHRQTDTNDLPRPASNNDSAQGVATPEPRAKAKEVQQPAKKKEEFLSAQEKLMLRARTVRLLQCPQCHKPFEEPRTLIPCGHAFCQRCVEDPHQGIKKVVAVDSASDTEIEYTCSACHSISFESPVINDALEVAVSELRSRGFFVNL